MRNEILAGLIALVLLLALAHGETATPAPKPILSGPLAKLDIKDAEIEPARGKPKGTLTIAQHFALDPGWLDPLEHVPALTQQHYDYLVHDALIKPMRQGVSTYSLAEHAAWPCITPARSTLVRRPSGPCGNRTWRHSRRVTRV